MNTPNNSHRKGLPPEVPRSVPLGRVTRNSSNASAAMSDMSDDGGGHNPFVGANRARRRLFRKGSNDGSAPRRNHLRLLVSERKARQKYLHTLTKTGMRDNLLDNDHQAEKVIESPSSSATTSSIKQKGSLEGFLEKEWNAPLSGPLPKGVIEKSHPAIRRNTSTGAISIVTTGTQDFELTEAQKIQMEKMSASLKELKQKVQDYKQLIYTFPIEIRMDNLTYTAPTKPNSKKIKTVYNSSFFYNVVKFFKNIAEEKVAEAPQHSNSKKILDRVSLCLKPGRMYLVLGPPSSGKSSLLKAIAGKLSTKDGEKITGDVTYNGRSFEDETHFHIENAIAYVDQLDMHAPRLTVDETFEFAFQCKTGGRHVDLADFSNDKLEQKLLREVGNKADKERLLVDMNLKSLGLTHVRNTFVGDDEIRGVSGGQRRRVTVGEMIVGITPVLLGDEISNGLDAASTFEIMQMLTLGSKDNKRTRVISLLQPSPETVALFDELILIAEGQILYAGPISQVEDYFGKLGYNAPPYMDVADFLQLLSTPDDCQDLFHPPPARAQVQTTPYTASQLAELFRQSIYSDHIRANLNAPHKHVWGSSHKGIDLEDHVDHLDDRRYHRKYVNSFGRSTVLNLRRNLTLWMRDRRVLIANAAKNMIMGLSVGGVFFQTDDVLSITGVLFQGMLFIMLGAMTTAPAFVNERPIFYKQADANFFSAYPYILAKLIAKIPQTTMDCLAFGTIMYFMVGLTSTASNYFIFMAIIILFSILMNELLFVLSTFARTKDSVQVGSACLVFLFILFSGFIITPSTVPDYYIWIYWYNPMAWAYRALMINEYRSAEFSEEQGDFILSSTGFVDGDGDPFTVEWVGYTFGYLFAHIFVTSCISGLILQNVRVTSISGVTDDEMDVNTAQNGQIQDSTQETNISFKPVTLTFENVCYDVDSSTGNDTLRLLHDVDGAFRSGRMCALMGSSGAGKTTLMDVIAMRKTTGTVQGDIRLNGFPQDEIAFRRCSGYVEQFDVQTQQLTVRETVLFSARLRLDAAKVNNDDDKQAFVDEVIKTLELTPLADALVGNSAQGGLTFEQKKRLSIAVELAASPSILFLDEPTTGLDARSALLVAKLLRKVANQGRTICATIHQPSSAVFDMFDDLLLLKKGGRVVYFGETGNQSKHLIKYFEMNGASRIDLGDNPANWMLREIQSSTNPRDLADEYKKSKEYIELKDRLRDVRETQIEELEIIFPTEFAAPSELRQRLMNKRLQTIYWRSPAYNLSRLLVCAVIAFILGSIYLQNRNPDVLTEAEMRSALAITFLSFIIIGILSIISVLPVMLSIRDVFYRHRAAGMLDNVALGWALGTAEKWFIVMASFIFCLVHIGVSGVGTGLLRRTIRYWGIFTFNLAIYSYFGQAFMCFVPSMTTAQILASVFIGLNNFFSGLIVRPQFMTGFFQLTYWITPGHYVYEGLVLAQYHADERPVIANWNSDFFDFLDCDSSDPDTECRGTVDQYIAVFFGGRFNKDNELQDILVLALFLVTARVMTFYGLKKCNFSNS